MAVTTKSDSNSKNSVEEPVQHSSGESKDSVSGGLIRKRKFDGPSARPKVIRKDDSGVVRSHKLGGNRIKDNKSDRLSDIDDLELVGYLCTKDEIDLKRILWEAMNEGYLKAKKQKQAAEKKKGVSVKKDSKTTEKVEPGVNKRHSSRINYDALKSLNDELTTEPGSYMHGSQNSHEMHGSNKEDQHDDGTFGNYEDDTHYQYTDEDFDDDFDS